MFKFVLMRIYVCDDILKYVLMCACDYMLKYMRMRSYVKLCAHTHVCDHVLKYMLVYT